MPWEFKRFKSVLLILKTQHLHKIKLNTCRKAELKVHDFLIKLYCHNSLYFA